jgi:hypothetical protein
MWNARTSTDIKQSRIRVDVHIVLLLDTEFSNGGIRGHAHLVVDSWRHSCHWHPVTVCSERPQRCNSYLKSPELHVRVSAKQRHDATVRHDVYTCPRSDEVGPPKR